MPPFDLGSLLPLYDQNEQTRKSVSHNVQVLKCIRGGLRLAEEFRLPFAPRQEYWRLPEMRLTVAYFADRWTGRFAPAPALRAVALGAFQHMRDARASGLVTERTVYYEEIGGFRRLCEKLADHARRMPVTPEWATLRAVWADRSDGAGDDLASFLLEIAEAEKWEPGFARRFPWFPYLAGGSKEDLANRQKFFFGYANLWTTTNAYVRAGAQQFAPVIQNTPTTQMLDTALRWAEGRTPIETQFLTFGRDDEDDAPQDRSEHAPVVEVFGFLNLERAPFYNNLAETYRSWFGISRSINAYELTNQVGRVTRGWLSENPTAVQELSALFQKARQEPLATRVVLESVESPKVRRRSAGQGDRLVDADLTAALEEMAAKELAKLDARDGAAIALHLLLDSKVYLEHNEPVGIETPPVSPVISPTAAPQVALPTVTSTEAPPASASAVTLPLPLQPYGEEALAYLQAGLHVLFAGAPGTGKTTLAQFVGHAWDHELTSISESMAPTQSPFTTVGNSAWSPFHTVGGLMPDGDNRFVPFTGIFIDPSTARLAVWRLRNSAIVLDEMNRADLDRCIGDLYPLLSGSVQRVTPAGLPGVQAIEGSPRFRVIATVNDQTLDDIVFPISEGLSRRFQRIDLPGGSRDDVLAYLQIETDDSVVIARVREATEAVEQFFEIARKHNLLVKNVNDDDDRLPIGVAYFSLLKRWVSGDLKVMLTDGGLQDEARSILQGSLRTLARNAKWNAATQALLNRD